MDLLKELLLLKQALKEYKNLLGQLSFNQPLPDGYQSRRESLLVASSHLVPQIKRLTNRDESLEIYEFGKPRTRNMWEMGLRNEYDYRTEEAIDACIDNVTVAIGNLKTDIEMGIRDKQGNSIEKMPTIPTEPPKAFIVHGGRSGVLDKLREFVEALGIKPLVVEMLPTKGMPLVDKVKKYQQEADCAIILATRGGIIDIKSGKQHPRLNVIDELSSFWEAFPEKVILLLEKGVELPSNKAGLTYEPFVRQSMDRAFIAIARELTEMKILKAVKPPKEQSCTNHLKS